MVLALIWRLPLHEGPLLHFVVPSAVVALWAAHEAGKARYPFTRGVGALMRLVVPLAAGALIGVAPLVIWFASHGALHDLWVGVFVKSAVRMTVTFLPPPGRFATVVMAAAPAILLFGSRRAKAGPRGATLAAAIVLAVAAGLLAHGNDDATDMVNVAIRSVPILLPFVGLWWCVRSVDEPSRAGLSLLLAALAATGQLMQVPYARLAYFLYTAPLVILALAALLGRRRESAVGATVFVTVFLIVAGAGHPSWNAMVFPPERWAALPSPRGGLLVWPSDSVRWAGIDRVVSALPPGPLHAVFESPQYNFLLDRPNPRRIIYDVLADSMAHDAATTLRQLDSAGANVAILSSPIAGDIRPPWSVMRPHFEAVRRAFPHEAKIGSVEIRWRDRVEPAPPPAAGPRAAK